MEGEGAHARAAHRVGLNPTGEQTIYCVGRPNWLAKVKRATHLALVGNIDRLGLLRRPSLEIAAVTPAPCALRHSI